MSLYLCCGCNEEIPPGKPRVRCQQCEDYDICANCVVLGVASDNHRVEHEIILYRTSGFASAGPSSRAYGATGWPVLIEHDTFLETTAFNELMAVIFQCLDTDRLGYLTPEAFSAFCDLVELPRSDNVWRRTMESGPNNEHEADAALRRYLECLCINHVLRPRAPPGPRSTSPSGLMPLITPLGITGVYLIESLTRPDKACDMLNVLLQSYQPAVWRERGDVPREALPPGPDPAFAEQAAQARARMTAPPPRRPVASPSRPMAGTRAGLEAPDMGARHAAAPRPAASNNNNNNHHAWERAPARVSDEEARRAAKLRKAEAEREGMQRDMERQRERARIDNQLQYIEAQKRNHEATLRSLGKGMDVMREIGQGRYYRNEYYYE